MPDYIDRMKIENKELSDRVVKLSEALSYSGAERVKFTESQRFLMGIQLKAMSDYRDVLQARIEIEESSQNLIKE